jgi:hypothetical protein
MEKPKTPKNTLKVLAVLGITMLVALTFVALHLNSLNQKIFTLLKLEIIRAKTYRRSIMFWKKKSMEHNTLTRQPISLQ